MGISVEVNQSNFATAVVDASQQRPVLVDFFATWCGPCQMLKPVLEKLADEYDFVLAKVDIDQNPQLAHDYGIEGVPDVRIVNQGKMTPGFVGMLPEAKLRDLMAQLNLKSTVDQALETAIAAQSGDQLRDLVAAHPRNRKVAIAAAQFFAQAQQFDSADSILANALDQPGRDLLDATQGLRDLIQLYQAEQATTVDGIADQKFFGAIAAAFNQDYERSLKGLLALVGGDRKYRNDGARKAMVLVFALLGDLHPLTVEYRKQLTLTLY
jgi:putative thioredoxin